MFGSRVIEWSVGHDGGRVAGGCNNEEYLVTNDAISGSMCVIG